jgi:hypothetical protein
MALDAAERLKARRTDIPRVETDLERATWNGKLSALRRVLGAVLDFLDTCS